MSFIEQSGNTHWWSRSEKQRKNAMKVLKGLNRAITPAMVNAALPPLPPRLWRRMRRLRPDLYRNESKLNVTFRRMPKVEWEAFVKACEKWKVRPNEAMTAFIVLFTKIVDKTESEDKDGPAPSGVEVPETTQTQNRKKEGRA